MTSIFSKIIQGQIPCTKVYENEHVIAFNDIAPQAPVHILIVPKKEIAKLQDLQEGDLYLLSEVVKAAQIIAEKLGVEEGYRLITNNGKEAGQTVFHLHFHLLAGKSLSDRLG